MYNDNLPPHNSRIAVGNGGLMAIVEHPPVDREDGGSTPPLPFRSLGKFVHPSLSSPVSFERDSKTY